MKYKIEDNIFVGFYEEAEEVGTFQEISIEDWNDILDKQSSGEVIYYDIKKEKLTTTKVGQFEELIGGKLVYKKEKEVDYTNSQLVYLRKRYTELKIAKIDAEELGIDTTDIDVEIAEIKAQVVQTLDKIKELG